MNKSLTYIQESKESLLAQGVEKLKIIGFANVTIHNILIDEIYILYFLSFLKKMSHPKTEDEVVAVKELKSLISKLREL